MVLDAQSESILFIIAIFRVCLGRYPQLLQGMAKVSQREDYFKKIHVFGYFMAVIFIFLYTLKWLLVNF